MDILSKLKADLFYIDVVEVFKSENLGEFEDLGCKVLSADEKGRLSELING